MSEPVTSVPPRAPHAVVPVAGNICSAAPLPRRVRVRGSRQDPRPAPPGQLLTVTLMQGDRVSGADGWDRTDRRASERRCPRQGPAAPRVTGARRSPARVVAPRPWGYREPCHHRSAAGDGQKTSCTPCPFSHTSWPTPHPPPCQRPTPCAPLQTMPRTGMAPRALIAKKGRDAGRAGVPTAGTW